ncbi:unnamed protein product [Gongylonema pulchrum]|uniref:EGF-like domain-containing protein n=1 Tax=Gongylonema pulchrum TaxID=637853 RepID=A0A183CY51_9BILA|nr:unnamed protein product [Gongylonema pulchrum]
MIKVKVEQHLSVFIAGDTEVIPFATKCHPVTGECLCSEGWTGPDCRTPCPPNRWGTGCRSECQCQNDGTCDPITGFCDCPAGFMGRHCEIEALIIRQVLEYSKWGPNCSQKFSSSQN